MPSSVSKVIIRISLQGKGEADAEVFRHLSPVTLGELLRNLPLQSRVSRYLDQFIYVTSNVVAGVEKARSSFKRGDVAFLAANGGVCFFLKDSIVARPMNPLGRMLSGIDLLERAEAGDVIRLESI